MLFWTKTDLASKLQIYQKYFNDYRVHEVHKGETPSEIVGKHELASIKLDHYTWKPVCGGLYHTPIVA